MTASGAAFGRYELLGIVGQGGFATVYRARDPGLGRDVAIKALLPHLAADRDVRRRFVAEAQALAALRHPNIVSVYDVGEADGRPFFAMELIDGHFLAEQLDQGGLEPETALHLLEQLCSAVDYLHAAGLVHRDIKPANVLVDRSGRAVLMDFGVARLLDEGQHTRTGTSLGTPGYMSPEQVRGTGVGPAADIYALGVLAYELIAGRPPFKGDTAYVLHAQVYEPPRPLEEMRPGLPPAMYSAIAAALQKEPALRPRSATEFAQRLNGRNKPYTPPGFATPAATMTPAWPLQAGTKRRSPRLPRSVIVTIAAVLALSLGLGIISVLALRGGNAKVETPTAAAQTRTLAANPTQAPTAPDVTASPTRQPSAAPTSPAAPPTAVPSIAVTNFQVRNSDTWSQGRGDLQGCFSYQNAPGGSAMRIRIARAGDENNPVVDSPLTPLAAAGGDTCGTTPAAGEVAPGNYIALLFDDQWRQRGSYAFNVQAPPPPAANIGRYAVVTPTDGVNVRAQPGLGASVVGCLAGGARFEVSDGPRAADGQQWYYARDYGWISANNLVNGPGPITSASTAVDTIRAFYEALDRHDLSRAWSLLSSGNHAANRNDYAGWAAGFNTTRAVIVNKITVDSSGDAVDFVYLDVYPDGRHTIDRAFVTWGLVQEGGALRLENSTVKTGQRICG